MKKDKYAIDSSSEDEEKRVVKTEKQKRIEEINSTVELLEIKIK